VSAPLSLALYRGITAALEPLAPSLLRRRAERGKEDAARLPERLGRTAVPRPAGPLVWLHGVSVGESLSLLPLAEGLKARRPDASILITSGTRTSAELLAKRAPSGVIHQYAPVDAPGAVHAFLEHWRPDLGVLVESELWPNLLLSAQAKGVRLALASARMTQKSADGWARAPGAARALLSAFDVVLPQDAASAARLAQLGARIGGELNLKLAGAPLAADPAALAGLKDAVAGRKVVLAASTHPGEEALIAQAARDLPALLIVAPRHPDRGAEVAGALRALGLSVAQRTAGEPLSAATQAYVADTLGELGLFFRLADVVVMGGGFAEGVGGHNPLEPARLGRAILSGPDVFNAADLYAGLVAEGGARLVADGAALTEALRGLLAEPSQAHAMGDAALAYAGRQGAALDRALDLLSSMIPSRSPV
jgi:3-deoxy-D-manno-octulosonic-acid transferase